MLHTDHANRKLIPWVEGMIEEGERHFAATGRPLFSSHMLDLSEEPLEDNIAACATILERLQPLGMSLEIELGVTGGEEDGVGSDDDITGNPNLYTQPEDVLEAHRQLSPIGHFSVAASFGNVHGVYKPGNVQLRPEILKNSQALVAEKTNSGPNPLDLVFHGGSGSEKDKIDAAIDFGVFKMNIDTDTQFAFASAIGGYVDENPKAFKVPGRPGRQHPLQEALRPAQMAAFGRAKRRRAPRRGLQGPAVGGSLPGNDLSGNDPERQRTEHRFEDTRFRIGISRSRNGGRLPRRRLACAVVKGVPLAAHLLHKDLVVFVLAGLAFADVVLVRGRFAGLGFLRRRFGEVEDRFAVIDVNLDQTALGKFPEQKFLGQRLLDLLLDHARQRSRAVKRIVALLGQPVPCGPQRGRWSHFGPTAGLPIP